MMILKQVTPRVRVWAPQDDDVVLADEVLTAAVTGDPICWVNTILRLVEVERDQHCSPGQTATKKAFF